MQSQIHVRRSLVGAVLAALLACLVLVVQAPAAPAAVAAVAAASSTGKVRGNVIGQTGGAPLRLKMSYFKADWTYLGARNIVGGAYSISLPAGNYHLQFVDKRPAYDVKKFAPTDVFVKVKGGRTTVKNVRMRRGGAITGTVRAGGRPAAKARVVAANPSKQSFETQANAQGQFALGGLPPGNYSVFTYDHGKRYVGKSLYVPKLGAGDFANVAISLPRKAGGLLVDLYAGGQPLQGTGYATAVSRKTGQFWTAKIRHGSVTFQGLFPGRYKIVVPDIGRWIGRTGSVKNGYVKPGRTAFGSFALTQKGARVTGRLVTSDGQSPVVNATVRLYDKAGELVAESKTVAGGNFAVGNLRTQSGLTFVAFNSYSSDYGQVRLTGIGVATNHDKSLGTLELPRK